jgi:putative ABC transport system permease protein
MGSLKAVLRRMAKAPGFTAVALTTLALGIGATTAIFSVIEGVLIKPLPFPHAENLVGVWHTAPGVKGFSGDINLSPTMYFTYREENKTFRDFGVWSNGGATVTGLGAPEALPAIFVTYGLLETLDVPPALGRWFSQQDDTPGTTETVTLSYGYWQRRFGGSASVIGRTLTVDSRPRTIIGVMPKGFRFLNANPDLIFPQRLERAKLFLGQFNYQGIARLKSGVSIQQANADVARMLPIWLKSWPPPPGFSRALFENARFGPKVQPLKQEVVGDIASVLWVLMGVIGLVLLIACANVANLLLVRAEARRQELAIRAALGAGWGRIARELLLESMTLAILGGALGLGLAYGALRVFVAKGPPTMPRLAEIGIDPWALGFTLAISLFAGLLFGLIPVVKYAGPRVASALRGGGRSMSQGRDRQRARDTLVVVQVGLALVLLVGSALMIRTFESLRRVQPGFTRPEEIQLLHITIPDTVVKDPEQVMRMENAMLDKLAAVPGVSSVAFSSGPPLEGFGGGDVLYAEGKDYGVGGIPPLRQYRFATPGFFKTQGTPLIAGQDFNWTDIYQKRHVAIVSENVARETWGSPQAALGKRIREGSKDDWREVIGVVGDVHDDGMDKKPAATIYWPAMMDNFWGNTVLVTRFGAFVVRTNRAGTEGFLKEARAVIWSVDSNLPVFLERTMKELYDQSMLRTTFTLTLLAIAGAMALILGVVGIYGVVAYSVSQRTREIGIRIALGAQPAALHRMFVRDGLTLAGIGAVLGLAAAWGTTRLMASMLFGTAALDPPAYLAAAGILIAAAALASLLPARRATAVDPARALRTE